MLRTAGRGAATLRGMTKSSLRSLVVAATIGSFSVAALLGVIALLGGGAFGEGEGRILLTTLLIGSGSIAMLCCLATDETPYRWVGVLGGLTVLVPVTTGLLMIWQSWDGQDEGMLQTFGVGTTLGVTVAQICLLLALAHDRRTLRLLLWGTVVLALVLGGTVSSMIIGQTATDSSARFVGVVAILDVLGTVVTIALARFGSSAPAVMRHGGVPRTFTLPDAVAARVTARAAVTGRTPEEVVVEAVDHLLAEQDRA